MDDEDKDRLLGVVWVDLELHLGDGHPPGAQVPQRGVAEHQTCGGRFRPLILTTNQNAAEKTLEDGSMLRLSQCCYVMGVIPAARQRPWKENELID